MPVGCGLRSSRLDFRSGQVGHQEKHESVGRYVQVEIDKTVNEEAAASYQAGELQRSGKR